MSQTSQSYIEVKGTAVIDIENPVYISERVLSMDYVYDSVIENIQELKAAYFSKLDAVGFDTSQLTENNFGYLSMGFTKKGTIIQLKTSSKENLQKFLSVSMTGTQIHENFITYEITPEQEISLSKKAIENARGTAERTLKGIGQKLGNIISITNLNLQQKNESYFYSLYYDFENKYEITVKFELLK